MPTPNVKKKNSLYQFLLYALIGCTLTAALLALTFTGGIFAIMVSLAAAALLHGLVGIGIELYKNYQKPELTQADKFTIGVALGITIIAALGLMVVFPHIGIPIAGVIAISVLAFGSSLIPALQTLFKLGGEKEKPASTDTNNETTSLISRPPVSTTISNPLTTIPVNKTTNLEEENTDTDTEGEGEGAGASSSKHP